MKAFFVEVLYDNRYNLDFDYQVLLQHIPALGVERLRSYFYGLFRIGLNKVMKDFRYYLSKDPSASIDDVFNYFKII